MRYRNALGILVTLACLLAMWQIYIWVSHTPTYVLPTPAQTLRAARAHPGLLLRRSATTMEAAVLGLAASVLVAVALALAIARWTVLEHVILTYALLIRTLPIVGVAPIVTLVAGRGLATSVLCVMVVTVFSLLIAVIQGFDGQPAELRELADVYHTGFARRARLCLLPGAMGSMLQGMRSAAPLAVLGALLAEWLDGFPGVGSLMVLAQADQEIELLMAAAVTAVALSLVAFAVVDVATAVASRRGYRVDQLSAP